MSMIRVEGLVKSYGPTLAVDGVSFSVEPGELVGFLGKNGAGKTTTMRVLVGALGATEGLVQIQGLDVEKHPHQVKSMVGYLPEVPPLHLDMTVRSFLRFTGRLRGVADVRAATERVIDQVGLRQVAGRVIQNLSKGYRQRVGIAQAILHRPKVLILDEPMSGLDPAQRKEIRDLVVTLSRGETTVLLSTHVLAEIEHVVHRVIVIDRGKIVAQDTVSALAASTSRFFVVVARPSLDLVSELSRIEGVSRVVDEGGGRFTIEAVDDVRERVAALSVSAGLLELRPRENLEETFLRLTSPTEDPSS